MPSPSNITYKPKTLLFCANSDSGRLQLDIELRSRFRVGILQEKLNMRSCDFRNMEDIRG